MHDCNVGAKSLLNFMWFWSICTALMETTTWAKLVQRWAGFFFFEEGVGVQPEGTRHTAHAVSL